MKKHIFFIAAICLLLASCAQEPADKIHSGEQSGAADLIETITENNIRKESEASDSTAESSISFSDESENDELCDTFLEADGFGKGCAFVNGFNLGRFWDIGPQKRLYLPAPLLKKGMNTIIIFETEGKAADEIYLAEKADLANDTARIRTIKNFPEQIQCFLYLFGEFCSIILQADFYRPQTSNRRVHRRRLRSAHG